MDLKRLFTDDDAVSPVIGVILMVAITVILAAVIASLVLGLGDEPQTTPSAQFEWDYTDPDGDGDGYVTISHNGGETLDADEVEIRGNFGTNWATDTAPIGAASPVGLNTSAEDSAVDANTTSDYTWSDSGASDISTGNSISLGAASDYDLTVTYVPSEGGNTAPLSSDDGPQA